MLTFVSRQPLETALCLHCDLRRNPLRHQLLEDAGRRVELQDWLTHKVRPMFEQRILPVDEEIMFKWRLLVEGGRKVGHTLSPPDLIIAATAIHYGLTVVTRNRDDYQKAGVEVFNPWTDRLSQK